MLIIWMLLFSLVEPLGWSDSVSSCPIVYDFSFKFQRNLSTGKPDIFPQTFQNLLKNNLKRALFEHPRVPERSKKMHRDARTHPFFFLIDFGHDGASFMTLLHCEQKRT